MLKIRLRRIGKKHEPIFAVVVAEHKRAVKGDFIEKLGTYTMKTGELIINKDRVVYWQSKGAKLSDTLNNILVKEKVVKGSIIKKTVAPKKKDEDKNENKGGAKAGEAEQKVEKPKTDEKPEVESKPAEEKAEESKTEEATSAVKDKKE
ncbi:MAG: 30S ribosomal protein S16 [Patescibacteria group bacterium]|nr:30S ribosomal protein S16 [Patescibacteria group bacterium]